MVNFCGDSTGPFGSIKLYNFLIIQDHYLFKQDTALLQLFCFIATHEPDPDSPDQLGSSAKHQPSTVCLNLLLPGKCSSLITWFQSLSLNVRVIILCRNFISISFNPSVLQPCSRFYFVCQYMHVYYTILFF